MHGYYYPADCMHGNESSSQTDAQFYPVNPTYSEFKVSADQIKKRVLLFP